MRFCGWRRALLPTTITRPSVKDLCSVIECGSFSQPAACSFGTTYFRHVSASFINVHPTLARCGSAQAMVQDSGAARYLQWFSESRRNPFADEPSRAEKRAIAGGLDV